MKDLLTAIKTQLQTDLTYVRDGDVFITEDENLIPSDVKFPAVGLKDGPVEWVVDEFGDNKTQKMTVTAIAYVSILRPEASVMGDNQGKGVLDIIDDIKNSLDENTLSNEVNDARIVSEAESEPIGDDSIVVQKKTATFQYVRFS